MSTDRGTIDTTNEWSLEPTFQQDLDGDGSIGLPPPTIIESAGTTTLARIGNNYSMYPVGGSPGTMLGSGGPAVTVGQFAGWTPIGAEKVGSTYQVVWKMGGQY